MSYPRDLDEIPTIDLEQELRTRRDLRMQGRCDYCGRSPTEPPCKFPERHELSKPVIEMNGFKLHEQVRLPARGLQLYKIENFNGPNGMIEVSWHDGKHKGYCFVHDLIKVEPNGQE